ncbi:MAG: 23S rRNA (adenine(2030)-N(6))-methyltransferase RlmJ [Steroidobacteraceae bacterium]
MKYRHLYHAGNFADVHKHIAVIAVHAAMAAKPAAIQCIDTHAGAGRYRLERSDNSAEAASGIWRLLTAIDEVAPPPEIANYVALLRRDDPGAGNLLQYAGSPRFLAMVARAQDRVIAIEREPEVAQELQAALADWPRTRILCADGPGQLRALLPAKSARSLLLIDPAYEDTASELPALQAALDDVRKRCETAVCLWWYPLSRERRVSAAVARACAAFGRPWLQAELSLLAEDAPGLTGSGFAVINPPFAFARGLQGWQDYLGGCLARTGRANARILHHETATKRTRPDHH